MERGKKWLNCSMSNGERLSERNVTRMGSYTSVSPRILLFEILWELVRCADTEGMAECSARRAILPACPVYFRRVFWTRSQRLPSGMSTLSSLRKV